jgi:hypothetical protein
MLIIIGICALVIGLMMMAIGILGHLLMTLLTIPMFWYGLMTVLFLIWWNKGYDKEDKK